MNFLSDQDACTANRSQTRVIQCKIARRSRSNAVRFALGMHAQDNFNGNWCLMKHWRNLWVAQVSSAGTSHPARLLSLAQ